MTTETPPPDGEESTVTFSLTDGTPEAAGVFAFLNHESTTFELLDSTVALDRRAAENIIAHRDGRDGTLGTDDDDLFDTVAELDDVAYVGPATIQKIYEYALANGWIPEADDFLGTFDGVPFTNAEAEAVLSLVNTATQEVLDDDVGLDSRAAANIVEARPISAIDALAAIAYVGPAALERLKSYAQEHGYPLDDPPPPSSDVTVTTLVDEAASLGEGSPHYGRVVSIARAIVTAEPYFTTQGNVLLDIADPDVGHEEQLRVYIATSAALETGGLSLFDDVELTGTFTRYGDIFELLLDDASAHGLEYNASGLAYEDYETIQAAWPTTANNPEGVVRVVSSFDYTFMVPLPLVLDHPMWAGEPPGPPGNSGNEQDHNWIIAAQDALDAWLATL